MIGLGAVAAPTLPPIETLADTNLTGVALHDTGYDGMGYGNAVEEVSQADWARERIADLVDPRRKEHRRKHWSVHSLDPNVHALRSMSLTAKVRMQQRISFERNEHLEQEHAEGVLLGLWK